MKQILILISFVLCAACSAAEDIRVAVIDTGLDLNDPRFTNVLCKEGHKDFTGEGIKDLNGHGTHVAGLIKKYAGEAKYCLLIYKVFPQKIYAQTRHVLLAYEYAAYNGARIVNFSGGGTDGSITEKKIINFNPQITFVVAAGNDGKNINFDPFYPASYGLRNIYAVGNGTSEEDRSATSNFGTLVRYWEDGRNVISTCPNNRNCVMSGSSMSTAIKTGKLIKEIYEASQINK